MAAPILILAVAHSAITADAQANGQEIRELIRQAYAAGARLIHFTESAASGYAKSEIEAWQAVDWRSLEDEWKATAALARDLGLPQLPNI